MHHPGEGQGEAADGPFLAGCHSVNSCGSVSVFQDMLKFELGEEEFFHRLLLHFSDVMKI